MSNVLAEAVATRCPACRSGHESQRDVYVYARVYLCARHRETWDVANERAHASGCPWRPAACLRCTDLDSSRRAGRTSGASPQMIPQLARTDSGSAEPEISLDGTGRPLSPVAGAHLFGGER